MKKNYTDIKLALKDLQNFDEKIQNLENCVTFFGSARLKNDNKYYKQCQILSQKLANLGLNILTGGGGGIMQAANEGAYKAQNSLSIGLNIKLPFEQNTNPYTNKNMVFNHLFLRRLMLIDNSIAFVIFPGGFGTLDELFETLTRMQTKIMKKRPVFLYDSEFFDPLMKFIKISLLKEKTISEEDLKLFEICDDIEQIYDRISHLV